MNRFKFLSSAVMAAFFAFSLASCEKEDFKTDVDIDVPEVEIPDIQVPEGYKPGDAVLTIQPTVIAVIDGEIKNVTSESKITYNGKDKFEYALTPDKGISAMEVVIAAAYEVVLNGETKTLTAESTLSTPSLSAGQVAVFTPTLVVSAKSNQSGGDQPGGEQPGGDQPGGDQPGGDQPGGDQPGGDQPGGDQPGGDQPGGDQPGGDQPGEPGTDYFFTDFTSSTEVISSSSEEKYIEFRNPSNYYYPDQEVKFAKADNEVVEKIINPNFSNNVELNSLIGAYTSNLEGGEETFIIDIFAQGRTLIPVKVTKNTVEYTINANYKSRSTMSVEAATIKIIQYSYIYYKSEAKYLELDGTGHSHSHGHGHGHSHGHGYDNAGGGIIVSL